MEQFSISFSFGKGSAPHGGNIEHNNREFLANNVNDLRSPLNIVFARTDIEDAYHQLFDEALEKYNAKQKRPCRRIQDYYNHIASGNRESPFYEAIVQFGDSINSPVGSKRGKIAQEMLTEFMKDFQKRNPNLHVFNATLHLDEASPHLHIDFVPFYTKGRKNSLEKGVSMKAALEEMGFCAKGKVETQVYLWVQSEKKAMDQILQARGYVREDKHVKHKHMSVEDYKAMKNTQQMMRRISARLGLTETNQSQKELQAKLAASEKKVEQLEKEKKSPYACFYYSSADKLAYVQDALRKEGIHFRDTDNGFEAQECFTRRIREIEKTYQAPASTIRDRLRDDIDSILYQSKTFDEFIEKLKAANYEVKQGKYISVKPPYGQRFIRLKYLGVHYSEDAIRNRLGNKIRFEARIEQKIKELENQKAPNLCVLHEIRQYIVTVSNGDLPIKRKNHKQPYSWVNDSEIDKLLRLNKMLNAGMDIAAIRQKAESLEAAAQKKGAELEQAENDLRQYLEMKEKIEIVFEGKQSSVFSLEQAKAAVRKYPDINASNYRNIDKVVEPAQQKVQDLSAEQRAIRADLKETTDVLSVIERTTNHTFVQHLVADQRRVDASELFMNGIYSGESL